MTKVIPTASIPREDTCTSRFIRFGEVKKVGDNTAATATTIARPMREVFSLQSKAMRRFDADAGAVMVVVLMSVLSFRSLIARASLPR
jgi:hypothetical protein